MEIKCPCCGTPFRVEIETKTNYTRDERAIFSSLNSWLKGHKPYKDTFRKIADYKYKFNVQLQDSPEGDTWVDGIVKWIPGERPEILEKNFSPIRF